VIRALRGWRSLTAYAKPNDLLFPNFKGDYWSHDGMIKSKWQPLSERVKALWQEQRRNDVREHFNWHALRHFAISCWIEDSRPRPCRHSQAIAACR
jgi:hypothetical protein